MPGPVKKGVIRRFDFLNNAELASLERAVVDDLKAVFGPDQPEDSFEKAEFALKVIAENTRRMNRNAKLALELARTITR